MQALANPFRTGTPLLIPVHLFSLPGPSALVCLWYCHEKNFILYLLHTAEMKTWSSWCVSARGITHNFLVDSIAIPPVASADVPWAAACAEFCLGNGHWRHRRRYH